MTNIKDVAEYAGVSPSTVSRVLSNTGYIHTDTRKKVMNAVSVLNYTPNGLAKSLKMGRSNTIALMVPSIQNLIFPVIARGVEDTARKNGFTVILCNTDENVESEKAYINKLRTRWIDGFIVSSMLPNSDHIRKLREDGFPLVLTSRFYDESIDAVGIDNFHSAYTAVSYLIKTGHKKIAFAMGRSELSIYTERRKGYLKALEDNGLAHDESLIIHETNGTNSFYSITTKMLQNGIRPDAIFASSDPKAIVIMKAIRDFGLKIPEDISILGFDNIEIAPMLEPPLSTVSQPLYEIGVLAAQKLIKQINHKEKTGQLEPPTVDILGTDLIIRNSTR